jgi:hypothetical protein
MTFAGEIKMTKVIKDGQEVIEWEQVDMSKHTKGNLGIGDSKLTLDGKEAVINENIVKPVPLPDTMTLGFGQDEVMRITKDGVFVNPKVSIDHAARTVLEVLDTQIKTLVQRAVEDEREACARVLDEMAAKDTLTNYYKVAALAIRERGAP